MKLDINVRLLTDRLSKFNIYNNVSVTIDSDYITNIEDAYYQIENYIWEVYGISLHYGEDFELDDDVWETINLLNF